MPVLAREVYGLVRLAAPVGLWQPAGYDEFAQPLPRLPLPGRGDRARGRGVHPQQGKLRYFWRAVD